MPAAGSAAPTPARTATLICTAAGTAAFMTQAPTINAVSRRLTGLSIRKAQISAIAFLVLNAAQALPAALQQNEIPLTDFLKNEPVPVHKKSRAGHGAVVRCFSDCRSHGLQRRIGVSSRA